MQEKRCADWFRLASTCTGFDAHFIAFSVSQAMLQRPLRPKSSSTANRIVAQDEAGEVDSSAEGAGDDLLPTLDHHPYERTEQATKPTESSSITTNGSDSQGEQNKGNARNGDCEGECVFLRNPAREREDSPPATPHPTAPALPRRPLADKIIRPAATQPGRSKPASSVPIPVLKRLSAESANTTSPLTRPGRPRLAQPARAMTDQPASRSEGNRITARR